MNSIGMADVFFASPLIILVLAALFPLAVKAFRGNRESSAKAVLAQGVGGIVASAIMLLIVYVMVQQSGKITAFSGNLILDGLGLWTSLLSLGAAAAVLFLVYDNPATRGAQFSELVFLTLSSVVGMIILAMSIDLVTVFIGLETMSIALYIMIAVSHEEKLSKEAAFKYFVLGSFASAIFLYGVAFLFGATGTTYIPTIVEKTSSLVFSNRLFLFGLTLVTLGFCFKVSIVPFHAWTPDVYQGAPTPFTALMSTAVKVVSFAAFLRILTSRFLLSSENLFDLIQWMAVGTMILGNIAALLQNNVKRMLAYSSIAHSGYLLVGAITVGISETLSLASSGVVFYLIGYAVMTIGALAVVSILETSEESEVTMNSLSGLGRSHPWIAFSLSIFMLSLAGIPPSVGFFGKFYLFTSALGEGLIWLAIWGVLNSVISVYYYLRPIVMMYMKEENDYLVSSPLKSATGLTIALTAILVLILGVFSGPVFLMVEKMLT